MRELTLKRRIDPANEIESLILEDPSLSWETLANNLGGGKQTMVVLFRGSRTGLLKVKERLVLRRPPHMEQVHILHEAPGGMVLFAVERSGVHPLDISGLIQSILGPETVATVRKAADGVTWHILTQNHDRIREFLKALRGSRIEVERRLSRTVSGYAMTTLATRRTRKGLGSRLLTAQERDLMEVAVRMGFFDQPRRCSVRALARAVKIPPSTAHLRLRRAESKLILQARDVERF